MLVTLLKDGFTIFNDHYEQEMKRSMITSSKTCSSPEAPDYCFKTLKTVNSFL